MRTRQRLPPRRVGRASSLPTVSCFSKIQIGFTFLVPARLGSPGKRAVKRVSVRVCACVCVSGSDVTGPSVAFAAVDEEPGEAVRLLRVGRPRHQGPRVLPSHRLGQDREAGSPAALQAAHRTFSTV